ncbi:hypothetical protein BDY21DRAFT_268366, partial [Lineolata rhizophorae]
TRLYVAVALLFFYAADLARAVSLSNFTPRMSGLTAECNAVYTIEIPRCQESDFTDGACSANCVNSLLQLTAAIQDACDAEDVEADSIIGVFLSGAGVPSICGNVVITTVTAGRPTSTRGESVAPTTMRVSSATTQTGGLLYDTDTPTSRGSRQTSTDSGDEAESTPPTMVITMTMSGSSTATAQPSTQVTPTDNTVPPLNTGLPTTLATAPSPTAEPTDGEDDGSDDDDDDDDDDGDDSSGGGSPFDFQGGASHSSFPASAICGFALLAYAF